MELGHALAASCTTALAPPEQQTSGRAWAGKSPESHRRDKNDESWERPVALLVCPFTHSHMRIALASPIVSRWLGRCATRQAGRRTDRHAAPADGGDCTEPHATPNAPACPVTDCPINIVTRKGGRFVERRPPWIPGPRRESRTRRRRRRRRRMAGRGASNERRWARACSGPACLCIRPPQALSSPRAHDDQKPAWVVVRCESTCGGITRLLERPLSCQWRHDSSGHVRPHLPLHGLVRWYCNYRVPSCSSVVMRYSCVVVGEGCRSRASPAGWLPKPNTCAAGRGSAMYSRDS